MKFVVHTTKTAPEASREDLRAAERVFWISAQLAGRSGRGTDRAEGLHGSH